MVFQNYALYPYLTVAANIGSRSRCAKAPRAERPARARGSRDARPLQTYSASFPQLSGGQRQRVAMGRAIVGTRASTSWTSRSRTSTRSCASRCAPTSERLQPRRVHDRVRDARPGGGDDARAPGRGAEGRPAPAVRGAARPLRPPREHVRRRLHRLARHDPVHGARRLERERRPRRRQGRARRVRGGDSRRAASAASSSAFGRRRSRSRARASRRGSRSWRSWGPTRTSSASRRWPGRGTASPSVPKLGRRRSAAIALRSVPWPARRTSSIPRRARSSRLSDARAIQPTDVATPKAPYSPVVVSGDHVFTAGQAAFDANGASSPADMASQQGRRSRTSSEPRGGRLRPRRRPQGQRLSRRPGRLRRVQHGLPRVLREPYPARTTVQAGLPTGMLVEIEAVARRPA